MYAVIEDSGHQYKVAVGEKINVDVRPLTAGTNTIEFNKVMFVGETTGTAGASGEAGATGSKIGVPYVTGAKVVGKLTRPAEPVNEEPTDKQSKGSYNVKAAKIDVWYFRRRRQRHRTKVGHRQKHIEVTITEIVA